MIKFSFSRRIVWMEAGLTNKKPEVVANYYLDALEKLKGTVIIAKLLLYRAILKKLFVCSCPTNFDFYVLFSNKNGKKSS